MQTVVEQGWQPMGNPDALLFVFGASETGAVDLHSCGGRGELNGSAWPLGEARRIAHDRRSHSRNRRYRDRSDVTHSPGSGNAHSETSGHWGSSAGKADEGWIFTRLGETMDWLCESTVWGVASAFDRQILAGVTPFSSARLSYQFSGFLSPD